MQAAIESTAPSAWDVWGGVFVVIALITTVLAVVSIVRHRGDLSTRVTTVWLIITVIFPPLGVIAWFVAGRRAAQDKN
ncbi:PLDc N-terminal domain-containing protein [Demequina flava]|uniref:PLDc N-terminal domain-containing protein n=1 Tax=Demequina flava TaxID=1095025 RepID=UPI001364909F|nr:PLDc N-terminal domain-containing protein [Demequina flava]